MQVGSFARIAISVALLVCTAHAAPRYKRTASTSADPSIVAAERMWSAAEAETDPVRAHDRWLDAADAFLSIVEAGRVTKVEQAEAARAGLLALKNMLNVDPRVRVAEAKVVDDSAKPVQRPIPDDDKRILRLLSIYLRFDATSDEAASVKFLVANINRRFGHFDIALPLFHEIVDKHRSHETAEYAANLLLDSYNRLQRYDDMLALVEKLRADRAWLADKPDLARLLRRIRVQSVRVRERARGRSGDRGESERCGVIYSNLADEEPFESDADELLYNAFVCFEEAGSLDDAREAIAKLDKRFPASKLRERALARFARVEARIGHFSEAAHLGEQVITRNPRDKLAVELAIDTAHWRLLLGEVDRASRVLATVARAQPHAAELLATANLEVVAALLAEGKRARAAKLAAGLEPTMWNLTRVSAITIARTLGDAACPVALSDGLCFGRRSTAVMRVAGSALGAALDEDKELVELFTLDVELEEVLMRRRSPRRAHVLERYRAFTESRRAEVRAGAHARLAAIARHDKRIDDARAELEACVAENADGWREICERAQAELNLPVLRDRERLPAPAVRTTADAVETP